MVNRALLDKVTPGNHILMHDWWLGMIAAAVGRLEFIPKPLTLSVSIVVTASENQSEGME